MTLLLASSSPRRRELLSRLGIDFEVVPSGVEERLPLPREDPSLYALELARAKAAAVHDRHPPAVVLAADTVVAVEGTILGKPDDRDDALRMLALLRDRWHTVVTAVAVRCPGQERADAVTARVRMKAYAAGDMDAYVASGEPMDKAGAYAVQGLGGRLVEQVEGCYNAVVGLPLCLTVDLLRGCGIVPPREADCPHL